MTNKKAVTCPPNDLIIIKANIVLENLLRPVVSRSNATNEGAPLDKVTGLKMPRGTGSGICSISTSSANPISVKKFHIIRLIKVFEIKKAKIL